MEGEHLSRERSIVLPGRLGMRKGVLELFVVVAALLAFSSAALESNQNISQFGTFEFALNHLGSANLSSLSFTVSRTDGFTSTDDLLAPSSGGSYFAAHIVSSDGNTGYVAAV